MQTILQCDQIRLFLKVLGNKLSDKSSLNFSWIFGFFKKNYYFTANWATFFVRKIWALFYLTSGHTAIFLQRVSLKNLFAYITSLPTLPTLPTLPMTLTRALTLRLKPQDIGIWPSKCIFNYFGNSQKLKETWQGRLTWIVKWSIGFHSN